MGLLRNLPLTMVVLNPGGAAGVNLPYTLDFSTKSDGPLPAPLVGATWTIASGKALNTPTVDTDLEMVVNGTLETNISGWTAWNTPDVLERNTTAPISGSGDLHLKDGNNKDTSVNGTAIAVTAGVWYRFSFTGRKVGTRLAVFGIGADATNHPTNSRMIGKCFATLTTSDVTYTFIVLAISSGNVWPKGLLNSELSNREIFADNISLIPLANSELFTKVNYDLSNVENILAPWTIPGNSPSGVFGWWDGITAMQNCLVAWHDGVNIHLDQYVGSTYTSLVDVIQAYVAGTNIEIRKGGGVNTVQVWYGTKGQPDAVINAALVDNKHYGLFSTAPENLCSAVKIDPIESLPIWSADLVRYASNPVISTTDTGTGGGTAADPYIIEINGLLYIFFESTDAGSVGQIWMAQSVDGYTWTDFALAGSGAAHSAHPQIVIDGTTVHLYYQYDNTTGHFYVRHRSSPLVGFPDWSAASNVFASAAFGWAHMNEFDIFKHTDNNWYLLGITSNTAAAEDKYLKGIYCANLPTDWNTEGTEMSNPLLNVTGGTWISSILEITRLYSGGRTLLYFGINAEKGINVFEVTSLSPAGLVGVWKSQMLTFGVGTSVQWDKLQVHRMCPVYFGGHWICAYDGGDVSTGWKIGIATK